MTAYRDLGDPASLGLAVLLPGFSVPFSMPLLLSTAWAAIGHGWRVRLVEWDPPESRSDDWVEGQLAAAVGSHDGPVLVAGKSLATQAAAYVSERGWDAIWFTPLLHVAEVATAVATHPGRQLLVGGTADEAWVSGVAASSGADVMEIAGADHGLMVDDLAAVASAEVHLAVVRRVDGWITPPA